MLLSECDVFLGLCFTLEVQYDSKRTDNFATLLLVKCIGDLDLDITISKSRVANYISVFLVVISDSIFTTQSQVSVFQLLESK